MDVFKQREDTYGTAVEDAVPVGCISCDHTFRVSKNVSGFREEDEALVRHGNKLFLILGADQRVVGWTLTQTMSHDEIEGTLSEVSQDIQKVLLYYPTQERYQRKIQGRCRQENANWKTICAVNLQS